MENAAAFVVSVLTVIIIVVTIAIFILYGAGDYFYAGALVSIALGFADTWLVSKEKPSAPESRITPAKRKSRGNKKTSRR